MILRARGQPMGRDPRTIISLGKSVTDLEWVGEESRRIARIAIHLLKHPFSQPTPELPCDAQRMATVAKGMLTDSLEALARADVYQALEVTRDDQLLDDTFNGVSSRLTGVAIGDAHKINQLISATLMLRSIERVGDHACNIAWNVIFLVIGIDVRHVSAQNLEQELRQEL